MRTQPVFITVENLLLDLQNPRLSDEIPDQIAAIEGLVKDQDVKLTNLAVDILEHGLNPSDNLLVTESSQPNTFIVLEGNRRVVALKLMKSPNLISDLQIKPSLKRRWKELASKAKDLPEELRCVALSREEAEIWILRRHTGENEGRGIVNWDGSARARFRGVSRGIKILERMAESPYIDENVRKKIKSKFPITNLERLINTPEARDELGLKLNSKDKEFAPLSETAERNLAKVITEIANGDLDVSHLRSAQQRIDYAKSIAGDDSDDMEKVNDTAPIQIAASAVRQEAHTQAFDLEVERDGQVAAVSSSQEDAETSNVIAGDNTNAEDQSMAKGDSLKNNPRGRNITPDRSTLVPKSCVLKVSPQRTNEIYHELRKINVYEFPNSCAVLLRVFLDLSMSEFAKRKGINFKHLAKSGNAPRDIGFRDKIIEVLKYLDTHNNMETSPKLVGIRKYVSEKNHLFSIETLHQYVHSASLHPSPVDLLTFWNNLQGFFETIWNEEETLSGHN